VLIVSSRFLAAHPETVRALVSATVDSIDGITARPEDVGAVVNAQIDALTGKPLGDDVLDRALSGVSFTPDPLAEALDDLLADGVRAGTAPEGSIAGIYDLRLLNAVLTERGRQPVDAAGLGVE